MGFFYLLPKPLTSSLRASCSWAERLRTSIWCSSVCVEARKFSISTFPLKISTSLSPRRNILFHYREDVDCLGWSHKNDKIEIISTASFITVACNQMWHSSVLKLQRTPEALLSSVCPQGWEASPGGFCNHIEWWIQEEVMRKTITKCSACSRGWN